MKFFNAVKNGSTIGKGTVGELVRWIEAYVNVLFPDNGIDYWSDHKFGGGSSLKHEDPVPAVGRRHGPRHRQRLLPERRNAERMRFLVKRFFALQNA